MACLFRLLSGPYRGKIFPVDTRRCLAVGTALEADFTIPDGKLLPFHCDVLFDSGRNGRMARIKTRSDDALLVVDGVPMDEVLLQSGDRMRIGNTTVEFLEGGDPDDPAAGRLARAGVRCAACRRPIPNVGGGRVLLNRSFCWRCVDLRLTVSRELGRYRILRKIDRGTATISYAAEDLSKSPTERVALHVLKAERQGDPRILRRFLTSAVFAYTLDHPLFARTRDLIHRPDVASYVTDLVEWETMQDRLLARKTFDVPLSVRIILQLAEALRYARERGIVVGRIRPNRLLISDQGQVRLKAYWLDPAAEERIARGIGAPDVPRVVPREPDAERGEYVPGLGNDLVRYLVPLPKDTTHYLHPERDVRPLGVLLFQLATGRHPGKALPKTVFASLQAAHEENCPTTAPLRLSPAVAEVIERTLAADPSTRYGNATEAAEGLKAAYLSL